jgi:hypothetical protein
MKQEENLQNDMELVGNNAKESFFKYTEPYNKPNADGSPASMKDFLTVDNGIRAVKNLATHGQSDSLQSVVDFAVDGGLDIKSKINKADVVKVENQELGPETRLNDKQHLEALSSVSEQIKAPDMKARFDSAVKSADNCLDTDGITNIQDPSKALNKKLDGEFINDTTLANISSRALTSAATLATGGIGGLVAGEAIDYGKEKIVNNSRLGNYINQTEEYLGSCKRATSEGLEMGANDMVARVMKSGTRGDVQGIEFDNKGAVSDIFKSEAGGANMKHFKPEDDEGQKVVKSFRSSISDSQSSFFDNMDLDSKLKQLVEPARDRNQKQSLGYGIQ